MAILNRTIYHFNMRWRKLIMIIFLIIILAHFLEHLAQMVQLYSFNWQRKDCLGLLGLAYPWMMKSETLHYGHALFMLLGLYYLKPIIFSPMALFYWNVSLVIQFWHHIEHALLLGQALIHDNFNEFAAPVSIAQLIVQYLSNQPFIGQPILPRIELHFFYNLIVLIPMLIALYYHQFRRITDV